MPKESLNEKQIYIGSELQDGSLRIEGPMHPKKVKQRELEIKSQENVRLIYVDAENHGNAILKIVTSLTRQNKLNE